MTNQKRWRLGRDPVQSQSGELWVEGRGDGWGGQQHENQSAAPWAGGIRSPSNRKRPRPPHNLPIPSKGGERGKKGPSHAGFGGEGVPAPPPPLSNRSSAPPFSTPVFPPLSPSPGTVNAHPPPLPKLPPPPTGRGAPPAPHGNKGGPFLLKKTEKREKKKKEKKPTTITRSRATPPGGGGVGREGGPGGYLL